MSDVESDDAAAQGGGDGEWEDWGDEEDLTSPTKCVPPRCPDSFLACCNPPTLPMSHTGLFASSHADHGRGTHATLLTAVRPSTTFSSPWLCPFRVSGLLSIQRGCLSRTVGDPMRADPRIPALVARRPL